MRIRPIVYTLAPLLLAAASADAKPRRSLDAARHAARKEGLRRINANDLIRYQLGRITRRRATVRLVGHTRANNPVFRVSTRKWLGGKPVSTRVITRALRDGKVRAYRGKRLDVSASGVKIARHWVKMRSLYPPPRDLVTTQQVRQWRRRLDAARSSSVPLYRKPASQWGSGTPGRSARRSASPAR